MRRRCPCGNPIRGSPHRSAVRDASIPRPECRLESAGGLRFSSSPRSGSSWLGRPRARPFSRASPPGRRERRGLGARSPSASSVVVPTSNRVFEAPYASSRVVSPSSRSTRRIDLRAHRRRQWARLDELPPAAPLGEPCRGCRRFAALRLVQRDANSARKRRGVRRRAATRLHRRRRRAPTPRGSAAALVRGRSSDTRGRVRGGPIGSWPGARARGVQQHPQRHDLRTKGQRKRVGEIWGGNMAVQRPALAAVGLFREGLPRQQEWEWEQRLLEGGGHMVYVPDAWLWHVGARPRTLTEAFLRGYTVGGRRTSTPLARAARYVAGAVAHAARARCRQGLVEGARHAGLLLGIVAARWRERRGRSVPGEAALDHVPRGAGLRAALQVRDLPCLGELVPRPEHAPPPALSRARRSGARPDELAAIQAGGAGSAARHAHAHVPFYRERFEARGDLRPTRSAAPRDLARLPLLTRADAQRRRRRRAARGRRSRRSEAHERHDGPAAAFRVRRGVGVLAAGGASMRGLRVGRLPARATVHFTSGAAPPAVQARASAGGAADRI